MSVIKKYQNYRQSKENGCAAISKLIHTVLATTRPESHKKATHHFSATANNSCKNLDCNPDSQLSPLTEMFYKLAKLETIRTQSDQILSVLNMMDSLYFQHAKPPKRIIQSEYTDCLHTFNALQVMLRNQRDSLWEMTDDLYEIHKKLQKTNLAD